jgi:hypothetical protein
MTPPDSALEQHDADDSGDVFLNMAREEPDPQPAPVSYSSTAMVPLFGFMRSAHVIVCRKEPHFLYLYNLRALCLPLGWCKTGPDLARRAGVGIDSGMSRFASHPWSL